MPKFTVEHKTKEPLDNAYSKVKEFLSKEEGLKKYDPKIAYKFDDSKKSCEMKGSQFSANLTVAGSGSGSTVSITVDLPLLLTPFKTKVQESLQRQMAKILA